MAGGGITRLIYGGNALLYHITLADYEPLIEWLSGLTSQFLVIPSVGPSWTAARWIRRRWCAGIASHA